MDKKERRKKLLMLDHLVRTGGDEAAIKALRAELEKGKKYENVTKATRVSDDVKPLVTQYLRLIALEFYDVEIMFVMGIGHGKLSRIKELVESGEELPDYENHTVVTNYKKARKKRWNYL